MVTRPTRALIGERGPEAVIPLHRMGKMGGASVSVGNVYVNANGDLEAVAALAGQQVTQAILRSGRVRNQIKRAARTGL